MLTNPRSDRVRSVAALSRRSARERTGLFIAEGPQAVREAVRWRPDAVRDLYVTPEAAAAHPEVLVAAGDGHVNVHESSPQVLVAMSGTQAPQGLLAVCRVLTASLTDVLARGPRLLLVLAQVRDPGNAGTVLRSADAAGADAVILSSESVDAWSPKVVRATAGSIFHLPVVTGLPIADILDHVRGAGVRLLAADGSGTRALPDVDLSVPHAWVMGNEAWGLTSQTRQACDEVVRVPIHGAAESLNLAMAATVCLYASAFAKGRPMLAP
ncbi:MAG: RNA methyltransferase [Candidatus Phosphoribacter sp.]